MSVARLIVPAPPGATLSGSAERQPSGNSLRCDRRRPQFSRSVSVFHSTEPRWVPAPPAKSTLSPAHSLKQDWGELLCLGSKLLAITCTILLTSSVFVGCTLMPGSTSSGLMVNKNKPVLPIGVPKRVAVVPFTGESPINVQAADQFSAGLVNLGFDVVERQHFDKIVKELEVQHSGMISDETIQSVGRQMGVEGLFVGSVAGRSNELFVNTYLNLKLVEVETGKVLWAGTFSDPRIFGLTNDHKESIIYTTKKALEILEEDLRKARN